jgi:hypothetical protein
VYVPADGTKAATAANGDFGTSPIFGQLSDKPLPARILLIEVWTAKHNASEKLIVDLANPIVPMLHSACWLRLPRHLANLRQVPAQTLLAVILDGTSRLLKQPPLEWANDLLKP